MVLLEVITGSRQLAPEVVQVVKIDPDHTRADPASWKNSGGDPTPNGAGIHGEVLRYLGDGELLS